MMMAASSGALILPPATFVSATFAPGSGGSPFEMDIDLPASGAIAGDYVFIAFQGNETSRYAELTRSLGGWTQDNYAWTPVGGWRSSVFHKQVTAADISGDPNVYEGGSASGAGAVVHVYRGATSAVRRVIQYENDGDGTHTTPGIARAYNSVGLVAFLFDRDPSATDVTETTAGGTFTERIEHAAAFRYISGDCLPRSSYISGADIVWSGLGTGAPDVSQLYELLI